MYTFKFVKVHHFCCFIIALITTSAFAGEGMWLPFLLKSLNETEMKSMGMKMNAEDIYSINQGSLKDAVVHFGGFCTAEVISDQGLLLTNHHCGYISIQSHSTLEKNYLKNGFWAPNHESEIPNPGLFATFIIRIEDVTDQVLKGVKTDMESKEKQSLIDANLNLIKSTTTKEQWQDVMIKPFFEANQYYMFVTETYNDVRYVGSPPESIGKFGADTDNWVWPRHTGDFSVFRIYAGPDNRPAAYSIDNKPLKPKHFFPISLDGVAEGDFTLVFGFPGKTNEYLPSYAVDQIANVIDPERIEIRNISLGIMDKHMRSEPDARLAYAVKYAGLANSWKKWIGEAQGLKTYHVVQKKKSLELDFIDELQRKKSLCKEFGEILPSMKRLYKKIEPIVKNRTILSEVIGGNNIELFRLTLYADRLVNAFKENGDDGYQKIAARTLAQLDDFYKDYRKEVDKEIFVALISHLSTTVSPEYLPADFAKYKSDDLADKIYSQSIWISKEKFTESIQKGGAAFSSLVNDDMAFQLFEELKKIMDANLSPAYNVLNDSIQVQQKSYMAALMEVYPDRRFWPDANNTMRFTYGQVEPYTPRDGVEYKTQTYLDGVMEKYKPGDYEFDVDPRLISLYENKDYGQYGENGKMPVCFIASNHTTGGNSGSPAIDAYGNLIGINFDRVWEGTMSDLFYDKSICRNIMVDVRYILFIIDKFAGAGNLIEEMKLVHPKH
ncbi:MAG: S46 family peptidase [Saprospiraceae bacterium]